MIDKRILFSFYSMLLIGLGANLVAVNPYKLPPREKGPFECIPFYKKLLTPTLFYKDKRLKQLEVLAATYIKEAIAQVEKINKINEEIEQKPVISISPYLNSLIETIYGSQEANEDDVRKAKVYIKGMKMFMFKEKTFRDSKVIDIYKKKYEKLGKAQLESFLRAELRLLEKGYKEIIDAIDKLGRKTKLPREITIETLSSFSSRNGPSRSH